MRGISGKNVLITGAASGIGRATALRFAQEGANVGILDLDLEGAQETVAQIKALGGSGGAEQADISDHASVQSAVAVLEGEMGAFDVLVNNAGWDKAAPFLQTEPELWQKIVAINLMGPVNLHHVVVAGMVERGGGKVVNVASDAGRVGSSGEAVYSACKGGIISFGKTLARELARSNVQINTVCPGPTDTPLLASFKPEGEAGDKLIAGLQRAIPMRRLGQPEDYPGMIVFLASADADYITGQTISVSGGLTMHG
ncbi:MAG: SDR family oxidoreductase [Alphaproteobacteria bacterium]|nr:SDR family oxidoreductase [Alphaproteobacteria bacterium]